MIDSMDHIVLTVRDTDTAATLRARVLGMLIKTFAGTRKAPRFGNQKSNLQTLGQGQRNHACIGAGDLCLTTRQPPEKLREDPLDEAVEIVEGPVKKSGALGPITSIYFNDPDGNLLEVSSYKEEKR